MLRTALVALGMGLVSVSAAAQGRGAPPPPPTDTVAPAIPGVVAAGAPVHVIKDGFNGSEGPIALPDGSVIFSVYTPFLMYSVMAARGYTRMASIASCMYL